jgi:uncharacterized protein YkwD
MTNRRSIFNAAVSIIAAVLGMLVLSHSSLAQFVQPEADFTGCGGLLIEETNSDFEQAIIDLVNEERRQAGAPPLKLVSELGLSARYHAADMAWDGYTEHDTYDWRSGKLVRVCSWVDRVLTYYSSSFATLGENIAAGTLTPSATVQGWMNSEGHRVNLLNPEFWEIGAGYYVREGGYTPYWVQDYARQSGRYPLVINREAMKTASAEVELYLYGSWQEMRLRNDGGEWTEWMPFQSSVEWTLEVRSGLRTVYAEMRSGNLMAASEDTIFLYGLEGVANELHFHYALEDGDLLPAAFILQPNLGGEAPDFTWVIEQEGSWFSASPSEGGEGTELSILPADPSSIPPGAYTGALTVTVTNPGEVANSPWTMLVSLHVLESFETIYLPVVSKEQ